MGFKRFDWLQPFEINENNPSQSVVHHLLCNYYTLFGTITFQKLPEHTCSNYFIKLTMSNMYSLYLISNIVHSQLLSISRLHLYKQLWQNNRPWNWDYPKEIRKTINYLKQCTNLLIEISILLQSFKSHQTHGNEINGGFIFVAYG